MPRWYRIHIQDLYSSISCLYLHSRWMICTIKRAIHGERFIQLKTLSVCAKNIQDFAVHYMFKFIIVINFILIYITTQINVLYPDDTVGVIFATTSLVFCNLAVCLQQCLRLSYSKPVAETGLFWPVVLEFSIILPPPNGESYIFISVGFCVRLSVSNITAKKTSDRIFM